ncbi:MULTISPECIES: alpha/beta fold hydrolase [Tenacibaculum]|uniref:alpha/beta fold hydrolase n=1 Tax=Tenacibaculum TaxID=104267 RepID=UPI001F0A3AD2|nr:MULTISPECIES: alpha/beta hydrolase [Tenacibaculum]MCH3883543.1 alpha/beta hydrolase [Tenacibaculum aquimarinum]MDO6598821.1 alpha/beta hydrolase [Tenacibaculum sp. 1_MG-2023]
MENNKTLYTTFTKMAIKVAMINEYPLKKAKALVAKKFEDHPFEKFILKSIKNDEFNNETLIKLTNNCINICEEFGPDRDYITLILVLESINLETLPKEIKKDISSPIVAHFREEIIKINKTIPAPPPFNMFLETRSLIEWSTMFGLYYLIPKKKQGKNKPVLLMPPYLGNDTSTKFVRKYLKSVGFKTYKWELGVNMINSKYLPKLVERLDEIYEKHGEKVSLVGWSGGGIFAKIIANRYPDKVEQLVTIGSPVWGVNNMQTPLVRVLEFLRGKTLRERNDKFLKELEEIPKVPVTCIYTKTDGLVPWKHCLEAETMRKNIKNVEVYGSHMGMGANASVLVTVANALIENTQGKKPKGFITKLENMFFPKFWERKKGDIVKDLISIPNYN